MFTAMDTTDMLNQRYEMKLFFKISNVQVISYFILAFATCSKMIDNDKSFQINLFLIVKHHGYHAHPNDYLCHFQHALYKRICNHPALSCTERQGAVKLKYSLKYLTPQVATQVVGNFTMVTVNTESGSIDCSGPTSFIIIT